MRVDRLAAGDAAAWKQLLEFVFPDDAEPASATFVAAALAAEPDPAAWPALASAALNRIESDRWTTSIRPLRRFRAWWAEGVVAALPPDDLGRLALEVELCRFDVERTVDEVDDVATRIGIASPGSELHVDALLLLALREREDGRHRDALASAEDAATHAADLHDLGRVGRAARAVGQALLLAGDLDRAFEVLDTALETRGPLFGGGGSFRGGYPDDRLARVLDEAATVAAWADHDTPEWIRAVGAIAEVSGHAGAAERFAEGLERLADQDPDRAVEDLEVVIRHASERDLPATADAAAQLLAERFADADSDAAAIAAEWEDGRAAKEALAEPDPEVRLVRLLDVLEGFDDEETAESVLGHRVVDALLALLLEKGDERAVHVATRLYDAKVLLHGEDAPSAWLELQNLGTVHAQLGRVDDARDCLGRALAALERLAPGAPQTEMARRNLARLG